LAELVAADRLEVLGVVDAVTDYLSTTPRSVIPEWTSLLTGWRAPGYEAAYSFSRRAWQAAQRSAVGFACSRPGRIGSSQSSHSP
jgi:hypothetical protein